MLDAVKTYGGNLTLQATQTGGEISYYTKTDDRLHIRRETIGYFVGVVNFCCNTTSKGRISDVQEEMTEQERTSLKRERDHRGKRQPYKEDFHAFLLT